MVAGTTPASTSPSSPSKVFLFVVFDEAGKPVVTKWLKLPVETDENGVLIFDDQPFFELAREADARRFVIGYEVEEGVWQLHELAITPSGPAYVYGWTVEWGHPTE